ncbi:MAG TPA: hypothetical protein VIJ33_01065 [Solirubrobacteraceae bacterium]
MRQPNHPPTLEQLDLTRWAASLGAVTPEALAHRRGVSVPSARARLVAAQRRGLLVGARPLSGRPALFAATRAGLHACDARGIQACNVSPSNAKHLIVCAAVAAALEHCYPDHRLTGEHELRRDEREQGHPLASARLLGGAQVAGSDLHRPDLVLWPDARTGGLPVAVEVELTVKARPRLVDICRAWARCREVAGALYLAPQEVERPLLRAIAEARASELVAVVPLGSLPGVEAAFA